MSNGGVPQPPCSYVSTLGNPCSREHLTSLAPYADLKKFRRLVVQVDKVVAEAKGDKAKLLGKQLVANLRNRIISSTVPGVARGTMMVNTKSFSISVELVD